MSIIVFAKMVAMGNDFVLVDNRPGVLQAQIDDFSRFARVVSTRKRSIGADGLLLLENSKKADITMRIFNPDGSEAAMCGNGARCMAYYAAKKGITGDILSIETKAGILKAQVIDNAVRLEMTQPEIFKNRFPLEVGGQSIEVGFVNTGVPHVVYFVEDLETANVKKLGREIRYHKQFAPEGTNVDFVKVRDRETISIRTYERGVEDETLACGTGAIASAIMASERNYVDSPVRVKTQGGEALFVYFKNVKGEYRDVFLEGEVNLVYEGGMDYV